MPFCIEGFICCAYFMNEWHSKIIKKILGARAWHVLFSSWNALLDSVRQITFSVRVSAFFFPEKQNRTNTITIWKGFYILIRKAAKEDIAPVMSLWLETNLRAHGFISGNYWTENFAAVEKKLPEAVLFVYEDSRQIQGVIGLTGNYIAGLFVREGFQSRGIGKSLLDHAKKQHCHLTLHVYQRNSRAVRFYLREGFAVTKELTDGGTGEAEYLMEWDLSSQKGSSQAKNEKNNQ